MSKLNLRRVFFLPNDGTIILVYAEFNAHFSQAKVESSMLNAVQSDRLTFMLELTLIKSSYRKLIAEILKPPLSHTFLLSTFNSQEEF